MIRAFALVKGYRVFCGSGQQDVLSSSSSRMRGRRSGATGIFVQVQAMRPLAL